MAFKTLSVFSECFLLFINILAFVFITLVYTTCNSTNTIYLESVAINWNTSIVINPSINPNECGLPSYLPLISSKWPGTVTGCFGKSLDRRTCGDDDNGRTYSALEAVPYNFWRGNHLCSSRITASYLDLTISENSNNCPVNFKPCGKIDTIGNFMC